MKDEKLSKLLAAAAIAGLVAGASTSCASGQRADADSGTQNVQSESDKNGCSTGNGCNSPKEEGKSKAKKKDAEDKVACGGPNGCGGENGCGS